MSRALAVCCRRLGVAAPLPTIAKFPRTAHLFDAGGTAVTSDDLVLGDTARFLLELDASEARAVVIEEKLDGGNIGISRGLDGELLVQNRSHYVSSGDHAQYRPLFHTWLREPARRAALEGLLPPGGDVILFGEWLLARHSVPYLALPDHFVAFDVYDRRTEKFWSRPRFHAAMRTAGLAVAPVVAVRDFASELGGDGARRTRTKGAASKALETALRALLETRSRFRTDGGPVEGVVLRVDDADGKWLKRRCKIVRPDFVAGCGDGHWATRAIERQRVDYELASQYLSECHSLAPPVEPAVVAAAADVPPALPAPLAETQEATMATSVTNELSLAAATLTAPVMRGTTKGVGLPVVVLSPSCPTWFLPKDMTMPSDRSKSEWQ